MSSMSSNLDDGPPESLGGGGGLENDSCRDRGRSFLLIGLQDVVESHEAQGAQLVG